MFSQSFEVLIKPSVKPRQSTWPLPRREGAVLTERAVAVVGLHRALAGTAVEAGAALTVIDRRLAHFP